MNPSLKSTNLPAAQVSPRRAVVPALPMLLLLGVAGAASSGYAANGTAGFDPAYRTKARPVQIVSAQQFASLRIPNGLVRLPNGKLALMVRNKAGAPQPFYPLALGGNGYWRKQRPKEADLDKIFANYRKVGANTTLFGIHWRDIEPERDQFDFTYTDMVVRVARKHDVKVWWVLFMHFQPGGWPEPDLEKFWVYNLDSSGGEDRAVQWARDPQGTLHGNMAGLLSLRAEIYPSYSHPEVFPRILKMLRTLGAHYRASETVIGLQLGNEEGFMFLNWQKKEEFKDWQTDFSPAGQALYADWKRKTGKSDWFAFKYDAVKFWWTTFVSAFHEADPYKVVSFNQGGGEPEAHYEWWMHQAGADSTLYREGNIDVIGTMFYDDVGKDIWPNLDQHHSYLYELPILIPSEIGMRRQDWRFQANMIATLERGGQGLGVWSYSAAMVRSDGELGAGGAKFRNIAAAVSAFEDVIHPGVPGPGDVTISVRREGAKVSHLHTDTATLGILHFPEADPRKAAEEVDLTVAVLASKPGQYELQTFRKGAALPIEIAALITGEIYELPFREVLKTEAIFVKIKRVETTQK